MKQSEKIIFRTKPMMKSFVREFAEKMGMDTSDFMRLVLEYWFLCYFCKEGSYKTIRQKFFDLYPEHNPKTTDINSKKDKIK